MKSANKAKIQEKLLAGERFSVTTDEYTSNQNRRYTAVNLHPPTGRPIKIGMMRIWGSLPGKKAASDLKKKLLTYGVKTDHHIVANTTDGASGKSLGTLRCKIDRFDTVVCRDSKLFFVLTIAVNSSTFPAAGHN